MVVSRALGKTVGVTVVDMLCSADLDSDLSGRWFCESQRAVWIRVVLSEYGSAPFERRYCKPGSQSR